MAYATGVASSLDDFLSQLVSFAVTNAGFANAGSVTSSSGSGSRTIQRISKGGVYWNFSRYTSNNGVLAAMGYSSVPAGYALPASGATGIGIAGIQQYWTEMGTWAFTGPFVGHYFFTDGTCVHAVIEIASGIYNHISFGSVSKYGSWVGGEYVTAGHYQIYAPGGIWEAWDSSYCTRPFNDQQSGNMTPRPSYVRVANTAATADFGLVYGTQLNSNGMFCGISDAYSLYGRLLRDTPNETTGRTPLLPGLVRLRDGVTGLYSLGGYIPHVTFMKMSQDMNPKDIINTDWQIFPITMRTGGNTTQAAPSYEYALAYRRI
jgi:hypothetical protein